MSDNTQYFRKFPTIEYNGVPAKNILRRVDIKTDIKSLMTEFYAYTLEDGQRIETLSHDYYDDVDLDWLIYHTNDVIDPYHDFVIDAHLFKDYIIKKYQSVRRAKRKTRNFINNYLSDDSALSSSGYEALTASRKKYWKPAYGFNNKIISYVRSEEDFTASTNMIVNLDFISASTGTFQVGEVISVSSDSTSTAEVTWANNTTITIQHVQGDFTGDGSNYSIIGDESAATATVDYTSYNKIRDVIPSDEQIYYKPDSFYDYEDRKNESNRSIYLVSSVYSKVFNKQLDKIMSE